MRNHQGASPHGTPSQFRRMMSMSSQRSTPTYRYANIAKTKTQPAFIKNLPNRVEDESLTTSLAIYTPPYPVRRPERVYHPANKSITRPAAKASMRSSGNGMVLSRILITSFIHRILFLRHSPSGCGSTSPSYFSASAFKPPCFMLHVSCFMNWMRLPNIFSSKSAVYKPFQLTLTLYTYFLFCQARGELAGNMEYGSYKSID